MPQGETPSFAISVNEGIPNALIIRDTIKQSLEQKGLLDKVVFQSFGYGQLQVVEVDIGVNVPLEIAQSVLQTLSKE